ncbi:unnamed protein product [Nippostrongylus brasiliensis]|uniref:ZP domain-containing protein n=1 Tax=Nippostrongylus brasiliensis TaxID=27835 RepID=A0A0N4Y953_NIPBR|nr:unnamed protein product [Nippostrongylus brasiliensis]
MKCVEMFFFAVLLSYAGNHQRRLPCDMEVNGLPKHYVAVRHTCKLRTHNNSIPEVESVKVH